MPGGLRWSDPGELRPLPAESAPIDGGVGRCGGLGPSNPPIDGGVGNDGGLRCGEGESDDESEYAPRDRIALWTRTAKDEGTQGAIGAALRHELELPAEIDGEKLPLKYETHGETSENLYTA